VRTTRITEAAMLRISLRISSCASFIALALTLSASSRAATNDGIAAETTPPKGDGLFPESGHLAAGVGTGVPFVSIAEVAYAVSDRIALGAIGGVTPSVVGAGLRPRFAFWDDGTYRLRLTLPILYYPKTHMSGGEPWFLVNPVLSVDRRLGENARISAGAGLVGAACVDSVFGQEHMERFMGGIWNTLQAGGALRIAARTEAFVDAQVILRGIALAGDEWIGGPPLVASFGVVHAF
jgi:hypothetical protein